MAAFQAAGGRGPLELSMAPPSAPAIISYTTSDTNGVKNRGARPYLDPASRLACI